MSALDRDVDQDSRDNYALAIAKMREKWLVENVPGVKRARVIGDCELLQGDCLEVMPGLGPVDAVVTDPPYGISHQSNHGASWQGRQIHSDQDTVARDLALAGSSVFASFGTWKTPPPFGTKHCLVWDKGPAFGMGDLSFPWKPSFELIYVAGREWAGPRDVGVLRGPVQVSWEKHPNVPESERRKHPHQKPIWLLEALIVKLPSHFCVCDPFMGSGTTLVACAKLGRRGIGIELDPDYFDIACKRVEEAYRQPDLFVAPPSPPVQEGFDL